jgi:hypothetical protein
MKVEMELVQEMENVEERNSENYLDRLEELLSTKIEAIDALRSELTSFQQYRTIELSESDAD